MLSATSCVQAALVSKSLKGMRLRPESLSAAMVFSIRAWARMWASSSGGVAVGVGVEPAVAPQLGVEQGALRAGVMAARASR